MAYGFRRIPKQRTADRERERHYSCCGALAGLGNEDNKVIVAGVLGVPSFELDSPGAEMWDAMTTRPARDLPGVARLMERPSPFAEGA